MHLPEDPFAGRARLNTLWLKAYEKPKDKFKLPNVIKKGVQHETLFKFASSLQGSGIEDDFIEAALWKAATERLEAPENLEKCISNIMNSIRGYGKGPEDKEVKPRIIEGSAGEKSYIIEDDKKTGWVKCLGHRQGNYFYTSSSNPEIAQIPRGSHNQSYFTDLMPYEFWTRFKQWKTSKNGIRWDRVGSQFMQSCREKGQYSERNHRGRGAWKYKGKTVYNLGSTVCDLSTRQSEKLGRVDSSLVFTVSRATRAPHWEIPETFKPQALIKLCERLSWKYPSNAKILSGWIAISRMCGALHWRPHMWITGASNTGKSSLVQYFFSPLLGEAAEIVQGETTAAGLRQKIKCDAVPIIFEESETDDKRSAMRIDSIIEYARQCSSDNDATILKGTADGKGISYKAANMLCLFSINVSLKKEQDINRFCELELLKPDQNQWPAFRQDLENTLDSQYGHLLWSFICVHWDWVKKAIGFIEDAITDEHGNRRLAQQYAPMIAAYECMKGSWKKQWELVDAWAAIQDLGLEGRKKDLTNDSEECLRTLCQSVVRYSDDVGIKEESLFTLIRAGFDSTGRHPVLEGFGLKIKTDPETGESSLLVASNHEGVNRFFINTKWHGLYARSLSRLKCATKARSRVNSPNPVWCVSVPKEAVLP